MTTRSAPASAKSGPATRSRRWAWRSSIASPATCATSTWPSSCWTYAVRTERRQGAGNLRPVAHEGGGPDGAPSATPCARPICIPAWPTWPRSPATRRTSTPSTRSGRTWPARSCTSPAVSARRAAGEAFGADYELPNMTAYNETCAAVGNDYWNHRLFLLHADAKYIDVMERTLYNGLISGVSLDGKTFFYPNPLESNGAAGSAQPVVRRGLLSREYYALHGHRARLRLRAARRRHLGQPLHGQQRPTSSSTTDAACTSSRRRATLGRQRSR